MTPTPASPLRPRPRVVDALYVERNFAAVHLLNEGDEFAFVDTNTAQAVEHCLSALSEAGGSPERVRYLWITHVHLDHASGTGALLAHFPNAEVLAHPRAVRHLIDPSRLEASARGVYGTELFERLYGSHLEPVPAERVRAMQDDEWLAWGERRVRFLHTRGHANHHVCIWDPMSASVFTGDAFGLHYPSLQAPEQARFVLPSTSPTDYDGEAARATLDRIVRLGAELDPTSPPLRAYLTHFGELNELAAAAADLRADLEFSDRLIEGVLADADERNAPSRALTDLLRGRLQDYYRQRATRLGARWSATQWSQLDLDLELNAAGLVAAIQRRAAPANARSSPRPAPTSEH